MRRRWYDVYSEVDAPDLPDRPVSLVKDRASEMFGHWSTDWADSGWIHPGPRDPGGEGPAAPPGSQTDRTPRTVAVPVEGEYLVRDGKVYAVHGEATAEIRASWRTRWHVVTDTEAINA